MGVQGGSSSFLIDSCSLVFIPFFFPTTHWWSLVHWFQCSECELYAWCHLLTFFAPKLRSAFRAKAITPIESIKYVGHPGSAGVLDNCRVLESSMDKTVQSQTWSNLNKVPWRSSLSSLDVSISAKMWRQSIYTFHFFLRSFHPSVHTDRSLSMVASWDLIPPWVPQLFWGWRGFELHPGSIRVTTLIEHNWKGFLAD